LFDPGVVGRVFALAQPTSDAFVVNPRLRAGSRYFLRSTRHSLFDRRFHGPVPQFQKPASTIASSYDGLALATGPFSNVMASTAVMSLPGWMQGDPQGACRSGEFAVHVVVRENQQQAIMYADCVVDFLSKLSATVNIVTPRFRIAKCSGLAIRGILR
jgi:hypothetical protein